MTRGRVESRTLSCDHNGVNIKAVLRRQRVGARNWQVRWQENNGKWNERSTTTNELLEAEVRGREIIRGGGNSSPRFAKQGMPIASFVVIQKNYHARNARPEAGESTLQDFMGHWNCFLRVCPVKTIHEVTEREALKYLSHLKVMSKTENHGYKKKSPKKLSVETIKKAIRSLAAAWNRVREGHSRRVGGLLSHQLVQSNPWEGIRNNIPQTAEQSDEDPVQFELVDDDLGRFLDQFKDRPVGELFIITSLWCWGRIKEMTRMKWDWINGDYVKVRPSEAKKGRGKIARLPPTILERLKAIRDPGSPYVFAKWTEDFKRQSKRPTRVQSFTPNRMLEQLEGLIPIFAEAIRRPEISHHALRRTAMELAEEAELRKAEKTSAEKLQTTVENKSRHYTKRLGLKAFTLADGLYANLTTALHDFPSLAQRLGCEPLAMLADEQEAEARNDRRIQRQRLASRGGEGAEGQGVVA